MFFKIMMNVSCVVRGSWNVRSIPTECNVYIILYINDCGGEINDKKQQEAKRAAMRGRSWGRLHGLQCGFMMLQADIYVHGYSKSLVRGKGVWLKGCNHLIFTLPSPSPFISLCHFFRHSFGENVPLSFLWLRQSLWGSISCRRGWRSWQANFVILTFPVIVYFDLLVSAL